MDILVVLETQKLLSDIWGELFVQSLLYQPVLLSVQWNAVYKPQTYLHMQTLCVSSTVEIKEDPKNGQARGLYIPCPDDYKNYCIHGDCQFPSILAQPSCRYSNSHTNT